MKYFTLIPLFLFASNVLAQTLTAPQILSATGVSPEHIAILYIDTNLDESTYSIAYSTTSPDGPWIEDTAGNSNTTSGETFEIVLMFNPEPSTTFYIKMRALAMDETGEVIATSPYSNIVTATTTGDYPAAPENFAATAKGNHILLTWTDLTPEGSDLDEFAWLIRRADDGGTNYNVAYTVDGSKTFFIDKDVVANVMYTYQMEAVNEFGNGALLLFAFATVSKDFLVYPNPTDLKSVTVKLNNDYNGREAYVTIYDVFSGDVVYGALLPVSGNKFELDAFQTLPEGRYLLAVDLPDGLQMGSWVFNWPRSR